MPGPTYTFTGYVTTGYQDYRDTGTGKMLVADPGESYGIAAIDMQLAVPPPDGKWVTGNGSGDWAGPPEPPPPVPEVPEVPPVTVPEGGE